MTTHWVGKGHSLCKSAYVKYDSYCVSARTAPELTSATSALTQTRIDSAKYMAIEHGP